MTQPPSADLLNHLADLLGPKGFSRDPDDMAPWLTDWRGRYRGQAAAMLSPANRDEVAAVVRLCAAEQVAIVPQGGNSGMVGGATPDATGNQLLLSLRRMNRIRDIDVAAGLAIVEAGVVLEHLHGAALAHGLRFPLTLGGKGSATVGGLVSTNAGGTQVLRFGTMRALVEGVEAVLPDGELLDALAPLKKDNRGYDLRHLFCGAEGTIGVVTAGAARRGSALLRPTMRCASCAGSTPRSVARSKALNSSPTPACRPCCAIFRRPARRSLPPIPGMRSSSWPVMMVMR